MAAIWIRARASARARLAGLASAVWVSARTRTLACAYTHAHECKQARAHKYTRVGQAHGTHSYCTLAILYC